MAGLLVKGGSYDKAGRFFSIDCFGKFRGGE